MVRRQFEEYKEGTVRVSVPAWVGEDVNPRCPHVPPGGQLSHCLRHCRREVLHLDGVGLEVAVWRYGAEVERMERIHDLDLAIGTKITFGPSDHQGSHKVWGTVLDEKGTYQDQDLD